MVASLFQSLSYPAGIEGPQIYIYGPRVAPFDQGKANNEQWTEKLC